MRKNIQLVALILTFIVGIIGGASIGGWYAYSTLKNHDVLMASTSLSPSVLALTALKQNDIVGAQVILELALDNNVLVLNAPVSGEAYGPVQTGFCLAAKYRKKYPHASNPKVDQKLKDIWRNMNECNN